MKTQLRRGLILHVTILFCIVLILTPHPSNAGGKVGIYVIHMVPYGIDAKEYSRPGWGGGLHAVVPVPQLYNILAGVIGLEYVNLLSTSFDDVTYVSGVPFDYTQITTQHYFRLYLGPQIGGHGNAFFRPHAGLNFALVNYGINTDVVIRVDTSNISKNKSSEDHWVFGYDLTMGLDLNFDNKICLDGGVKYVKSFSVPQQLGDQQSVKIFPQYFQIYFGLGISFELIEQMSGKGTGHESDKSTE